MSRIEILMLLLVACGCERSDSVPAGSSQTIAKSASTSPSESAFTFDEAAGVILLDTRSAAGQRRRFDLAQGSVTLETRETTRDHLRFLYTCEIEGSYTIYECTGVVSDAPVTITVNADGTPGETSFDLTECRVIGTGHVHTD